MASKIKAERFTVHGAEEEGPCVECGFPLYEGDGAYLLEDSVYCSRRCAGEVPPKPKGDFSTHVAATGGY